MLIGMFHNRKDPNMVSRSYLYSAIAKLEGADLFYFTARCVNIEKKTILGKYFEDGGWKEKEFPYPDVVMNIVNAITENEKRVTKHLEKYVPFTSHPVGSKLHMYNLISQANTYKDIIIPYKKVRSSADVFEFLNKFNKVVVKPSLGHHGDRVISIEIDNNTYIVKADGNLTSFNKNQLKEYIDKLIPSNLVIQKYINSRTKSGEPFDFRIHMQKGITGNWLVSVIYPRIGRLNTVATNISKGARFANIDLFLMQEYGKEAFNVKRTLEYFALNFIKHFEYLRLF